MRNLRDMKTLSSVKEDQRNLNGGNLSELFKTVNEKLIAHGFGENLKTLDITLAENQYFHEACNKINSKLEKHKCVFVLCNSGDIMWKIHAYFPVIYAINDLGKSVFRTTVKNLIDSLLSKDDPSRKLELRHHLSVFTGILYPDPRLNSMGPSVEYLFEDAICNSSPGRKLLFTAYNYFGNRENAVTDSTHRLRTYYSPKLEDIFKRNVELLYIDVVSEVRNSWISGDED